MALAQAAFSVSVGGTVAAVERLRGQSHLSLRVERVAAAPVVLRIEPQRGILPPYDLPSEARLLGQLRAAGLPTPAVLAVGELDGRALLVLEWVPGRVLAVGEVEAPEARAYSAMLRRIHTLDWQAAGLEHCLPAPTAVGPAQRERAEIAVRLDAFGIADRPHIRRLREALDGLRPEPTPPRLVHGDVNFGNFIIQPLDEAGESDRSDRSNRAPQIAAVLDWEQAHLGDPLSDWGRLAAEDLLGNLQLSESARTVLRGALDQYECSAGDLRYWTLHQLYKHASATGALSVIHGWDQERIAALYTEPTARLLSGEGGTAFCP